MKIELIKKTDLKGTYYYTTVNDKIIVDSLSFDKEKAEVMFKCIIENKGKTINEEMIDCTIIED